MASKKITLNELKKLVKQIINEENFSNQDALDRILDKINSSGIDSLNQSERNVLKVFQSGGDVIGFAKNWINNIVSQVTVFEITKGRIQSYSLNNKQYLWSFYKPKEKTLKIMVEPLLWFNLYTYLDINISTLKKIIYDSFIEFFPEFGNIASYEIELVETQSRPGLKPKDYDPL